MSETIFDLVKADLDARDRLGHQCYGGPMRVNPKRDSLQNAYEEVLDLAIYLKEEILKRNMARA